MKNRMVYVSPAFLVLATLSMLMAGNGLVLAGQDDVTIDKVRLDFNAAFNQGNAKAMDQLIDPNGVWLPPGALSIVGRENIVAHYAKYFDKVRSKFELKPGDIQLCDGWSFLSGDFSRADTPKAGGAVKQVTGHYLLVLKKQTDGAWKIARDIWNETVTPEGTP